MRDWIPILMYHQIAPRPLRVFSKYTVTPKAFAVQMKWLALARYTPINLDDLIDYRCGRRTLPSRPIIITFDDGYQECINYAVPILQSRGFTAVFYLVAGLMGETSRWLRPELGIELPLIDWATARQLEAAGFQCGAHSISHPHLAELPHESCCTELRESRCLLEEHLGHEVRHMAYPYGSYNEHVRTIAVEAGYRSACSVNVGISTQDDDLLSLQRIPVTSEDSLLDFICRLRTGGTLSDVCQGKVQSARRCLRKKGIQDI